MRDTDTLYNKESIIVFTHFDQDVYLEALTSLLYRNVPQQMAKEAATSMSRKTFTIEVWTREPVQYVIDRSSNR